MVVLTAADVPHQTQTSENYPGYLLWPESSLLGTVTHFPARLTREIPRADGFLMESIRLSMQLISASQRNVTKHLPFFPADRVFLLVFYYMPSFPYAKI